MPEPVIVPRAEHPISRRDIDPDALKVLYRLQQFNYIAYLVGGSVRDLLLQRRPKDFDIGTDAHPYQVKKLFRNCWIIGRRFRLAHVRFGNKAIEVATFRRHILPGTENEPATTEPPLEGDVEAPPADLLIRHDNTFGTPEEDAFRRDFTINALFYDIATFSIIDYVGGLQDLRDGLIRSIGDPASALPGRSGADAARGRVRGAPRLPPRSAGRRRHPRAPRAHRQRGARAADRGVLQGAALGRRREDVSPACRARAARNDHAGTEPAARRRTRCGRRSASSIAIASASKRCPRQLSNPILLGTLIVPLGLMPKRTYPEVEAYVERPGGRRFRRVPKEPPLRIGMLPVARRDTERLRQMLSLQRRMADLESSPRAKRALMHRGPFEEALVWFEIHGHAPEALEHWRGFIEAIGAMPAPEGGEARRRPTAKPRRRAAADAAAAAAAGAVAGSTTVGRHFDAVAAASRDVGLPVLPLELLHEVDQRVDAFLGERVVDRRAHAADRTMALEAVEAGRRRFLHERVLELFARQPEGDVHPRRGCPSPRCRDRSRCDRSRRRACRPCARCACRSPARPPWPSAHFITRPIR